MYNGLFNIIGSNQKEESISIQRVNSSSKVWDNVSSVLIFFFFWLSVRFGEFYIIIEYPHAIYAQSPKFE